MKHWKQSVCLALSLALLLGCMVTGAGAAFLDAGQIKHGTAVNQSVELNIINGYPDGNFRPDANVTRAEMCKMICAVLGGGKAPELSVSSTPVFSDVRGSGDAWAESYIEFCSKQGIVAGVGGGRFEPGGSVTFDQAAKMLLVVLGSSESQYIGSGWSTAVRTDAQRSGLYSELSGIDGSAPLNRDNAAQLLWNALQAKTMSDPSQTLLEACYGGETPAPSTPAQPEPTPSTPAPAATVSFPLSIQRKPIAAGPNQTLILNPNGTVKAAGLNEGGGLNVQGWTDIVALAPLKNCTVGLKSNGTLVYAGSALDRWSADLMSLRDVVAIENSGGLHSVFAALHSDGTVTYIDDNLGSRKLEWSNIVQIAAGGGYLIGLKADGTAVSAGVDWFKSGCTDVSGWTDMKFIAAGMYTTLGVRNDGTVTAVGEKTNGKAAVEGWRDIVAVACGNVYSVGLRADGTVVGTGLNGYGQLNVEDWRDIVAISVNTLHTVGLRADGTVLATGANGDGQCDVNGWTVK